MILFLDFDGVLHPRYENGPVPEDVAFCHLPRFEAVMRDFPEVQIVISSTWREQFGLDKLRMWFSADIAARIIGTTPEFPADHPRSLEQREAEILAWLGERGDSSECWLALDDSTWQFRHYRDHLVACTCHVGLDGSAEVRLRAALSVLSDPSGIATLLTGSAEEDLLNACKASRRASGIGPHRFGVAA